jgi:hypothetical protein
LGYMCCWRDRSAFHIEAGARFRHAPASPKHPNLSACLFAVYCLGYYGLNCFNPLVPPSAPERTLQTSGQGQATARLKGGPPRPLLRACIFYALGGECHESADEAKLRGHVKRQAHARKIMQPNEIPGKKNPGIFRRPARAKHKIFCQGSASVIAHAWPTPAIFFLCALREGERASRLTSRPERASDMHPQAPDTQTSLPACLLSTACDEHSEQARAPHTNGPRDAPRCGVLNLLQKTLHFKGR